MIMKQVNNTGGRVVTFRKILVNPSSGASFVPVANGTTVAAGAVQQNVVSNGLMVSSVTANGILTSSSNGLVMAQHTNGVTNSSAAVGTHMMSNGIINNCASVSTSVNSTITNGVIHSGVTLLNGSGGSNIRPQNGRVAVTAVSGGVQQPTLNTVPGRICLSNEQLQRLLEQQLNQQPNTGQPQIIRLQNPQQLIRLQQPQPQQFVRLQQPQQIIRIPHSQLSLSHGQQLADGRILLPQSIQLTQQQLQQLQQQIQQRPQQPITIQPLQIQQPAQQQQTQATFLPGVQVVSIANAQAALLQQHKQQQQFQQQTISNTVQQPIVTSHQHQVPTSQPLQIISHQQLVSASQQQQSIVTTQNQKILLNNNFTNTLTSQAQQQLYLPKIENQLLHINPQQNGQPNQFNSGQTGNSLILNTSQQFTQSTHVKIEDNNDSTKVEPKNESSHTVNPIDDDDDDIKEIGQVVYTKPSCGRSTETIGVSKTQHQ